MQCQSNGITESAFVSNSEQTHSLELCFFNITGLLELGHFASLKKLTILAQDLTSLSGLNECRALESLSVAETKITSIAPHLNGLTGLKELHLYEAFKKVSYID